jgi:nucleoside 2-deoxyribosyltransferase
MALHVVGGVYREYCVHPHWNDIYGSAGRAAIAIANMGTEVVLHSYMCDQVIEVLNEKGVWLSAFSIKPARVDGTIGFRYLHDMGIPTITGVPDVKHAPLQLKADKVVRFGMLEGDAVVDANWAVYDPQNVNEGKPFGANGSKAKHLALVLNSWEAAHMAGLPGAHPRTVAPMLAAQQSAEVVVVKMGPEGAFVWTAQGGTQVPAYRTDRVWKIGSGDCFVGHFANAWMHEGKPPAEAASVASRATSYYVETQGLPTPADLTAQSPQPIQLSAGYRAGEVRQVYLAGPFFDLSQVWMVEQARNNLQGMGLKVFSPYHDIGLGSADDVVTKDLEAIQASHLVLAIADGFDAGTVYEIGYARALNKPVVVYSERHKGEGLKMMEGSGCIICGDYTTALYSTLWEAIRL